MNELLLVIIVGLGIVSGLIVASIIGSSFNSKTW